MTSPARRTKVDSRTAQKTKTTLSLSEDIFKYVGRQIVSGELEPGSRISEKRLVARFRVSRTPVREAMKRLETIGLVEALPSRFTRVAVVVDGETESCEEFIALHSALAARNWVASIDAPGLARGRHLIEAVRDSLAMKGDVVGAVWNAATYFINQAGNTFVRSVIAERETYLRHRLTLRINSLAADAFSARLLAAKALMNGLDESDSEEIEAQMRAMLSA